MWCKPNDSTRRFRILSGFTLLELLVAISIIALLISVLLPALSGARQAATAIQCGSNQRQVVVGFQAYASDQKTHQYPPLKIGSWSTFDGTYYTNFLVDGKYVPGSFQDSWYRQLGRIQMGKNVWTCPAAIEEGLVGWGGGYGVNSSAVIKYYAPGDPSRPGSLRMEEIKQASRLLFLADARQWQPAGYYYVSATIQDPTWIPAWESYTSSYIGEGNPIHKNATTNVAYCDGHVKQIAFSFLKADPNRWFLNR